MVRHCCTALLATRSDAAGVEGASPPRMLRFCRWWAHAAHSTTHPHRSPQARGLTPADVGASARKLRLYRRLRRLDPQGFLALLSPSSRAAHESEVRGGGQGVRLARLPVVYGLAIAARLCPDTGRWAPLPRCQPPAITASCSSADAWCLPATGWPLAVPTIWQAPSRLVLLLEYLVSTAAALATAAAVYHVGWAWAAMLPPGLRAVLAIVLLWLPARQWMRARPTAGPLFGERPGEAGIQPSRALGSSAECCSVRSAGCTSRDQVPTCSFSWACRALLPP